MSSTPLNVENSPFNAEQVGLLNQLTATLSPEQSIWLSGYLAGIRAAVGHGVVGQQTPSASVPAATARHCPLGRKSPSCLGRRPAMRCGWPMKLSRRLQQAGLNVTTSCMSEFRASALKKLQNLLVITSTHGEGDPPDKARLFHEFLHGQRAPQLAGLRFSVLALGDLSYKKFCQTGKDFDFRLEALGAHRLHERVDCDVDFHDAG